MLNLEYLQQPPYPTYPSKSLSTLQDMLQNEKYALLIFIHPPLYSNNNNHTSGLVILESLDLTCQLLINYCKFLKVPYRVEICRSLVQSPLGTLPFAYSAQRNEESITLLKTFEQILKDIQLKWTNMDLKMSESERNLCDAYIALLIRKFKPALIFEIFHYPKSKKYVKCILEDVLGYRHSRQYMKQMNEWLNTCSVTQMCDLDANQIYLDYHSVLASLQILLSSSNHLFFLSPSQLSGFDIYCYTYLEYVISWNRLLEKKLSGSMRERLRIRSGLEDSIELLGWYKKMQRDYFPSTNQQQQ